MRIRAFAGVLLMAGLAAVGCVSDSSDPGGTDETVAIADAINITDAILDDLSTDCADYADAYVAYIMDLQRGVDFDGMLDIIFDADSCTLSSNGIPNHDFNDFSASFVSQVSEQAFTFQISRDPVMAAVATDLSQGVWDAVLLNGVVVDLLSAGCYDPGSPMADADGNVPIGCSATDPWLLDPLWQVGGFGADIHNAHVQPDGSYHYHGNPYALFDDLPGPDGSPVIGFAADGFPIFGSYFFDGLGVRKAVSGYTLIAGQRPDGPNDPGGDYDGEYIDDFEFTDAGDLDECNGMEVDGVYGYYVTDSYPWMLNCLVGTPDPSFNK